MDFTNKTEQSMLFVLLPNLSSQVTMKKKKNTPICCTKKIKKLVLVSKVVKSWIECIPTELVDGDPLFVHQVHKYSKTSDYV